MKRLFIFCWCGFFFLGCTAQKVPAPAVKDLSTFTSQMQKLEGFFNFYWDAKEGKIWLEVDKMDREFLYVSSLATGIGSNDIGLERGQLAGEKVVKFIRSGPKILLLQVNYKYRAESDNPAEYRSVEEAFAQSVIGGFEVEYSQGNVVLVDATDFFLRDAHQVIERLRRSGQGAYGLDNTRSAIYMERTKNFPKNSEFEAMLTFALKDKEDAGDWVSSVAPTASSITVRQHHSFVELPDNQYQKRVMDPRSGYFGISYQDYATPIDQPLVKQFIQRHRLQKKDPRAAKSEAEQPIVYYVDPGAPEPVRSALLEGARWWNQAFEAAGYHNAFRVEVLPEGVDPLDVRYNVIQWVHRSTRGWSYGNTVTDPRTGEIIKGHVSLGSLRVRQDFLIAQGLVKAYEGGDQADPRLLEMALARLRQLSAHEVGHTLGLNHNFAASTNGRASVMDYPHPFIQWDDTSNPDFSETYDNKIGAWDIRTILYGYQDFPDEVDEELALKQLLHQNDSLGLRYITDRDARPAGGAHPYAHLWDNGADPLAEMDRLMTLRKGALSQFGASNIPEGTPWSGLEEVLVPLYLSHRYQTEAVVKLIGGVDYTYAHRGDGQVPLKPVAGDTQRKALQALMRTLEAEQLALPESVLMLLPPKPPGYERTRESFKSRTGVTFDAVAMAESAVTASISLLLHHQRAARLVQQRSFDEGLPGLNEVIETLINTAWKKVPEDPYHREIHRACAQVSLQQLMELGLNEQTSAQVRAVVQDQLQLLNSWLLQVEKKTTESAQKAHYRFAMEQLRRYREDPDSISKTKPLGMPDGSPIGSAWGCGF